MKKIKILLFYPKRQRFLLTQLKRLARRLQASKIKKHVIMGL